MGCNIFQKIAKRSAHCQVKAAGNISIKLDFNELFFLFFLEMLKKNSKKIGFRDPHRKTSYSARNASMGSRFDALQAGYTPDTTQVMIPTAIAMGM